MNITNLTPRQQLRAGRMPLRLFTLFTGLTLFALLIGPATQFFFRFTIVRLPAFAAKADR